MDLLDFVRGPGLQIAVIIFVVGLAWRLVHLVLTAKKVDISEARSEGLRAGGIRAIFSRFIHHEPFRERTRNGTIIAYAMHISLAIVIFGGAPHILFIESFTGLSWPALPAAATPRIAADIEFRRLPLVAGYGAARGHGTADRRARGRTLRDAARPAHTELRNLPGLVPVRQTDALDHRVRHKVFDRLCVHA